MLRHQNEQTFGPLLRKYDEHNALIGCRVAVSGGTSEKPIHGRCEGLDAMGRLLLRDRKKLHHVIAGEVQVINGDRLRSRASTST
jgi:biotin-(acetyl-CoA carboxylase) ligase